MKILIELFILSMSFYLFLIVGESIANKLNDNNRFKIWWRKHWIDIS
jgi:hypothetical protein